MDEAMQDDRMTCSNVWKALMGMAVTLPVLYILSSGPAQCIEWKEGEMLSLSGQHFTNELNIPFRQGSFSISVATSRWPAHFQKFYMPLNKLANNALAGRVLNFYWSLFGDHSHIVSGFGSEILDHDILVRDESEEE